MTAHSSPSRSAGYLAALAALGSLFFILYSQSVPAAAASALTLTDCRLQSSTNPSAIAARCGWFEVAENRADPASQRIRLKVAVVPALNLHKATDPLVFLTGGPGEAATSDYPRLAPAFERIRRDRDILLVDQRGTGESNRLDCDLDDDLDATKFDAQQIKAMAQRCVEHLHGDARFYTTSVAVADLEAIRVALGYQQLNLWGGSYGTRVAQHYLRRYPDRVRTVILDGVVAPEIILGPGIAIEAQRALDAIFARCTRDEDCNNAFPALSETYATLRERIARKAVALEIPDPKNAQPINVSFGSAQLINAVRLLSYSDSSAALLPYLIASAQRNDVQPLAAQAVMSARNLHGAIAVGMAYAVQCSEDAPFLDAAAGNQSELTKTYIGREFVDGLITLCSVWPRGVMDKDFHEPLTTQVPALLLSGENDPVTPPTYAALAAKGFRRGKHLVLKGQGHIQSATACMPQILARFVSQASIDHLDEGCLDQVAAAPFLLNASASAP
jgi:pimeloyl-ACP methyl ester carboxylesterase